MKIAISVLILLFSVADISAQINSACPKITVEGPSELTDPGNTLAFKASANSPLPDGARFEWTVSAGTIESGQGSDSIVVRVSADNPSTVIEATVKIKAGSCLSINKEAGGVRPPRNIEPLDFYGNLSLNDEKARLQNAAYWLEQSPSYKLFIFKRFPSMGTQEKRRINDITKWITRNLKVPHNRFQILTSYRPQVETFIIIALPDFDAEKLK